MKKSDVFRKMKKKKMNKVLISSFSFNNMILLVMSTAALQNSCPQKFNDILWKTPVTEAPFSQPFNFS